MATGTIPCGFSMNFALWLQLLFICIHATPINVNVQRKIPKSTLEKKSSKISIGFSGEYGCLVFGGNDNDGCAPLFSLHAIGQENRQRKLLPRDLIVGTNYDLSKPRQYFMSSIFTKLRWPNLISRFDWLPFETNRKFHTTLHFEPDDSRCSLTIQSSLDRQASLMLQFRPQRRLNLSYEWYSDNNKLWNKDDSMLDVPPKEDWWMPDKLQWQASTGRLETMHQYSWSDRYRFRLFVSTNAGSPYPLFDDVRTTSLTCQLKYDTTSRTSTTATVNAQVENLTGSANLSLKQMQRGLS
mmetsp:Transcript_22669/g.34257  ORF Transcript_22669/g.34257 Transcript_22669/m.34257 type:complete len:297 (-) Transcript_22669:195-1085(-)